MPSPELWRPYVRIATPRVLLPNYVTGLVVGQDEGRHEWAQLTVRYHLPDNFRPVIAELPPSLWWAEHTPVRVTYGGTAGRGRAFVGYVVSPELLNTPDAGQRYTGGQMLDIRYTLLGPSSRMQSATERSWRECTVPYMAEQIGADYGMRVLTAGHPRVYTQRLQAAQSDFGFLRDRVEEIGWRMVSVGTLLAVTDPRQALNRHIPLFRQNSTPGRQDTMQAFSAVAGELDPAGARRLTHTTATLSEASVMTRASASTRRDEGTDPRVRRWESQVTSSYQQAQLATEAAAVRDLWWVQAQATVDGDTRLMPGSVVRTGGDALTSQYKGVWMVRSTRHRITLNPLGDRYGEYYTDMVLGRDQLDRLTWWRAGLTPLPGADLLSGRWQASNRRTQ